MPNQTLTNNVELVGGWAPFHNLTAEDKLVFDEALKGFVGVKYTPHTVSTQVVAGKNYRFRCTAQIPASELVWETTVQIYKPLVGKPYITHITQN